MIWKPKQTFNPASNVTLDTVAKALNANSGHGIMATASNPVTETKDNVLDTDTLLGETDKGNVLGTKVTLLTKCKATLPAKSTLKLWLPVLMVQYYQLVALSRVYVYPRSLVRATRMERTV